MYAITKSSTLCSGTVARHNAQNAQSAAAFIFRISFHRVVDLYICIYSGSAHTVLLLTCAAICMYVCMLMHKLQIKPEKFNTVVNIGKRITDFSTGGADDSATTGANADDQDDTVNDKLDEDMGVAVVFDSDDDDANGDNADNDLDEVRDSEDELDEDDDGTTVGGAGTGTSAARQERQLRGQDDDTIEEEDQVYYCILYYTLLLILEYISYTVCVFCVHSLTLV
jgi:hypothetical protein